MELRSFLSIAYRALVRNTRRSALTAFAVALGLVVAMMMASLLDGAFYNAIDDNVRVVTGHMQVHKRSYDTGKQSLLAEDLLDNAEQMAATAESLPGVQSAAPVLWSGGLLATAEESIGVEIMGIDPDDAFHEPIRNGIVAGEYLKGDDRGRILVSSLLAKQMKINLNDRVSIAMSNANGEGQEGVFTVVGLYDTGFPGIDQNRVILPLQQAQAFAGVDGYASSLILMLTDRDEAPALARQLESETLMVETWEDLNSIMLDSIDIGRAYYNIVYAIIFIMVAVLIVNTLLMSVFERLREIGVLASIGMRGRQIMLLFLLEAFMLTVLGIVLGWILGLGAVSYLTFVGIPIPAEAAALVEGIAFGTRMYGGFAPLQFVVLSLLLLVVVLLVSLYPAWFAARLEPVEALHAF